MDYVDFHGGFIIRYGFIVCANLNVSDSNLWARWDPIIHLVKLTTRDIGYLPVEYTLRRYLDHGEPTHERFSYSKPLAVPYSDSGDFAWYGSFLSSLAAGLDLLSGGPLLEAPPSDEHQVHHRRITGRASTGSVVEELDYNAFERHVTSLYDIVGTFPAYHDESTSLAIIGLNVSSDVSGFQFTGHHDSSASWFPRGDLLTTLLSFEEQFSGGWSSSYNDGGNLFVMGVFDFHVEVDGYVIRATYRHVYFHINTGNRFETLCVFENSWDPNDHGTITHLSSGDVGYMPVDRWGWGVTTFTRTLISPSVVPGWLVGVPFGITDRDDEFNSIYLSEAQQLDGTGVRVDLPAVIHRNSFILEYFDAISEEVADIRLSSAQSSSSAFDDLSSSIGKDNFQTLLKVPALADALPDLSKVVPALANILDHPILSMGDLVSAASQVKLQSSYQWSPTLSFVRDDLPVMKDLITRLLDDSQGGIIEGRGDFRYQFPSGTFGRESCSLTTRTKVVAKRSAKSVFSTIVDLRALGLPLTPSTMWDLVPFSFAANWFTGVGARIRDAEAVGFLIGSGTWYYVHSYTLDTKLTRSELGSLGIRAFTPGSEEPTLRYYLREVSKHPPRFRSGKFDFRLPTRPPDWMLVGSLLWQFLV